MMFHSLFMNLLTCLLGLFELAFFEGFQRKLSCMLSTHVLVSVTSFSKIFFNKWRFMEGTTSVIGECALIMAFIGLCDSSYGCWCQEFHGHCWVIKLRIASSINNKFNMITPQQMETA